MADMLDLVATIMGSLALECPGETGFIGAVLGDGDVESFHHGGDRGVAGFAEATQQHLVGLGVKFQASPGGRGA